MVSWFGMDSKDATTQTNKGQKMLPGIFESRIANIAVYVVAAVVVALMVVGIAYYAFGGYVSIAIAVT
uniref:ABC transporter permease n=1 Tax=Mesocestoides corti TaxID=53468 RepID=A0A5K3G6Q7_MESCO